MLGRHISRCAEYRTGLRVLRRLDARDTKISDLHLTAWLNDDISRLDVAVYDAEAMRILERVEQLTHDAHNIADRETLVFFEVAFELATRHEFHRDKKRVVIVAEVVDRYDVRMIESPGCFRFTLKARDQVG